MTPAAATAAATAAAATAATNDVVPLAEECVNLLSVHGR
jgi:hypothetical protein